MIWTFFLLIITAFASASADTLAISDNVVQTSSADKAKAVKSSDSLIKNRALSQKMDTIVQKKTSNTSSAKESSIKPPKKGLPVKKEKKVKEKKKGSFDFNKVFIALSKKIPAALHLPDKLFKSVIMFITKNTFKVVLLLSFLVIIVATLLFFRQGIEGKRFMTTTRLSVMDKEVQRACRHIESSFDNVSLSVDSICNEMVTGKAFLTALFERELGMTVEDFIAQVRINRAKIFIKKDSSADDAAVAAKTGFGDINQFKSTFEKLCGVSVDDYRKSLLANQSV